MVAELPTIPTAVSLTRQVDDRHESCEMTHAGPFCQAYLLTIAELDLYLPNLSPSSPEERTFLFLLSDTRSEALMNIQRVDKDRLSWRSYRGKRVIVQV